MTPPPAAPLPLAADRAALSNRISLLLANQSSVLKTMAQHRAAPPSSANAPNRRQHAAALAEAEQEDLWKAAGRPNEGVGYVPAEDPDGAAGAAASDADRKLRRQLLGKRKADGRSLLKTAGKGDDDEDDDPGRSALGKRKRPKKSRAASSDVDEEKQQEQEQHRGQMRADAVLPVVQEEGGQDGSKADEQAGEDGAANGVLDDSATTTAVDIVADESKGSKKKKKKRKKRKPASLATKAELIATPPSRFQSA